MASGRTLAGFLARLPAILAAVSRGVARAIWQLLEQIATAAWRVVAAIGDFIADIAKWLWRTYCKIEFNIVQILVDLALSIWSLRLLVVLIGGAAGLAYFKLWMWLAGYVAILALAVFLYFRMSPEDEQRASEAQRPMREWLTISLRWVFRILVALTSALLFATFTRSLDWSNLRAPSVAGFRALVVGSSALTEVQSGSNTGPHPSTPSPKSSGRRNATAAIEATPRSDAATPGTAATIPVAAVAASAEQGVLKALAAAQSEPRATVEELARQAGRNFDFSQYKVERNRKEARRLNEAALRAFQTDGNHVQAYRLQKQAHLVDPLDVEVAGNLAVFAFRVGENEEARLNTLYALALPRGVDKTGRTADWSTLAAVYAKKGDEVQARNALFVTLAIAPDFARRCKAAVNSVKFTYGEVLKEATEAMFVRIREQGLSDSPDCALPIAW